MQGTTTFQCSLGVLRAGVTECVVTQLALAKMGQITSEFQAQLKGLGKCVCVCGGGWGGGG